MDESLCQIFVLTSLFHKTWELLLLTNLARQLRKYFQYSHHLEELSMGNIQGRQINKSMIKWDLLEFYVSLNRSSRSGVSSLKVHFFHNVRRGLYSPLFSSFCFPDSSIILYKSIINSFCPVTIMTDSWFSFRHFFYFFCSL